MKQLVTRGIVLKRTDYGEADRIITLLTPEQGKLRLMARGVRKLKSKLAGGIELFSVSDITYIAGKGEMGTLVSSRLDQHYGSIIKQIDRVQLGYEVIKLLDRATEDNPEAAYFDLLEQTFAALDDPSVGLPLLQVWFHAQLLALAGFTPNLRTDTMDQVLQPDQTYNFDFDAVAFASHADGRFNAAHIKTLRLLFGRHHCISVNQVTGLPALIPDLEPLVRTMLTSYIRV